MNEKPPKKSTKGRKAMDEETKKIVIRASIPVLQAKAARAISELMGIEFNEFVEIAMKEAIYQATLKGFSIDIHADNDLKPLPYQKIAKKNGNSA